MSKVAIVGDFHYGMKHSGISLDFKINEFLNGFFFPKLKELNIKTIVHLGDLFNDRKSINTQSGFEVQQNWLNKIDEYKLNLFQIIGNHDCAFHNTNEVNSPKLIYNPTIRKNIKIIEGIYDSKNLDATFCGWEKFPNVTSRKRYLFGHFDIVGFEMIKGIDSKRGYNQQDFELYDLVFSGHYHRRSKKENIIYVGSAIDTRFGEEDVEHGFYVLDIKSSKYKFYSSGKKTFCKIYYDDSKEIDLKKLNLMEEQCFYKIIKVNCKDEKKFDKFIEKVKEKNPIDYKIKTVEHELKDIIYEEEHEEKEKIHIIMKKSIENSSTKLNKKRLYNFIENLYKEVIINE